MKNKLAKMKFIYFCFLCFANASSGGHDIRSIDKVYPNDPLKEVTRDDLNIIEEGDEVEDEVDIRFDFAAESKLYLTTYFENKNGAISFKT